MASTWTACGQERGTDHPGREAIVAALEDATRFSPAIVERIAKHGGVLRRWPPKGTFPILLYFADAARAQDIVYLEDRRPMGGILTAVLRNADGEDGGAVPATASMLAKATVERLSYHIDGDRIVGHIQFVLGGRYRVTARFEAIRSEDVVVVTSIDLPLSGYASVLEGDGSWRLVFPE